MQAPNEKSELFFNDPRISFNFHITVDFHLTLNFVHLSLNSCTVDIHLSLNSCGAKITVVERLIQIPSNFLVLEGFTHYVFNF